MGRARELLDRCTAGVLAGNLAALRQVYAQDAVAESPDGRLVGSDAIAEWLIGFGRAFPDLSIELTATLESGDRAIDEGYVVGTNTGPLTTPDGEMPATGKAIRVRECDVLTERDGVAISHHFYWDQLDFLAQLGLAEQTINLPEQARAQTGARVKA